MISVLIAAMTALVLSLLGTPAVVRLFRNRGYGQEIREDGPASHATKRGTPTMGGTVIIVTTFAGYGVAHLLAVRSPGRGPTASGLLLLGLMGSLGLVGFLDDFIKIRKQRSLTALAKFGGQLLTGVGFAVLALQFHNHSSARLTPASSHLSFVRDYAAIGLGTVGFVVFAYLMVTATSNAVNLTDGLDGLACGTSVMVLASYVIIAFWEFGNSCTLKAAPNCYSARDPLDVALVAAAAMGACFGFLWWNASPAKIFMGDTGSLSLGGLLAGIAILTRTELLLIVLGGLFVVETLSVIIQIGFFKMTRKRVFNMAPMHHHFELAGWVENTVIVRFWIIGGLAVAFGLGLFYAEFLSHGSLG